MRFFVRMLVALLLSLVTLSTAYAQMELFGVSGNGSTSPGNLVSVDQSTGETALVSAVTDSGLSGLAYLSTDVLYASTIDGQTTTSVLLRLDRDTTGVFTIRNTIGPITASDTLISISDLAVQPTTDILYGLRSNADAQRSAGELYTIDVSTGVATLVGATEDTVGGGIGFSADGTLWRTTKSGGNSLVQISPVDASTIDVTMTNLTTFYDGLAVRPSDGLIFCTRGSIMGTDQGIWVIDPLAMTETKLVPGWSYRLSDLAFGSLPVAVQTTTWGSLKQKYGAEN
jgi:hypothetical protein